MRFRHLVIVCAAVSTVAIPVSIMALSSPASAQPASYSVTCTKLAINEAKNTVVVSNCKWTGWTAAWGKQYKTANGTVSGLESGGTSTWKASGGTTSISAPTLTSEGNGSCKQTKKVSATEEQANGTVTAVTSAGTYPNPTSTSDDFQATVCVASNGKVTQAPGTDIYF